MRIESDTIVPYSRARVFECYRDEMRFLVDYLPNIRSIDLVSKAQDGDLVRTTKIWHGQAKLPDAIAKLVDQNKFSWTDEAVWDQSHWECTFQIEPVVLSNVLACSGTNRFVALDEMRTRIEINGEIRVNLRKLRALPNVVAEPLARTLERFFVRQVGMNLISAGDAVGRYLQAG